VNCVHCGRAATVQVAAWNLAPCQQATWFCAYLDCQKINGISMAGRIVRAAAHYGYSTKPARP
jgi:hypothetical protein